MVRKFCLIGIPDDLGVDFVGGRVGASHGPSAFRKHFLNLNGRLSIENHVWDSGNCPELKGSIEERHSAAQKFIEESHSKFDRSIVVGGGHDLAFPHLKAIQSLLNRGQKKKLRLGCINLDAHLDLRRPAPQITSGSPFYLALEAGVLKGPQLIEFGVQSQCNASELWEYAQRSKVSIQPFSKTRGVQGVELFEKLLRKLSKSVDAVVLSLDLDCFQESFAPGVSSPQPEGFSPENVSAMMEIAGQSSSVVSLGIFELNPLHDLGDRTARLASMLAYRFLESTPHLS